MRTTFFEDGADVFELLFLFESARFVIFAVAGYGRQVFGVGVRSQQLVLGRVVGARPPQQVADAAEVAADVVADFVPFRR